jgi:signal transduction histidine kinase
VAELEAVLTRTLTLHRPTVVEAEQLVFLPEAAAVAVAERTTIAPAVGRPTVAPLGSTEALAGLDLEVVLGELAHELRNPMVTIKTVAQHLDGLLADSEARARFSVLMAEAVGRMDGLLETLLDFARFRAPLAQSVDIEKVLDRVLAEHAEDSGGGTCGSSATVAGWGSYAPTRHKYRSLSAVCVAASFPTSCRTARSWSAARRPVFWRCGCRPTRRSPRD